MPAISTAKEGDSAPPPPWWRTAGQLWHFRFALIPSLALACVVMLLAFAQAYVAVGATWLGKGILDHFDSRAPSSAPVEVGSQSAAAAEPAKAPLFVKWLSEGASVPRLAGAMVLLLVVADVLAIFSEQCRAVIALGFRQRLQKELLAGLTRSTNRKHREAGFMHFAVSQDASGIGAVLAFGLLGTVETIIRLVSYVLCLARLPGGAGVAAVVVTVAILVNWLLFRGFLRAEEKATARNNAAMLLQHTHSLGIFQVLGRLTQLRGEGPFVEQVLGDSQAAGEANRKYQLITSLRTSLSGLLVGASLPLVVLLLVLSPARDALTSGLIIQTQLQVTLILAAVAGLLGLPSMLVQYGPVIDRLLGILKVPEPGTEPPELAQLVGAKKPLTVRVEDLRFAYPGSEPAEPEQVLFENLSFEVPAGALVGIIGESGSGKTTLSRVLQGEYSAQVGRIFFGGVDVSGWHPWWRRHLLGSVPSDAGFLKDTLRVNLEWGRRPPPSPETLQRVIRESHLEKAWEKLADTVLESADEHLSSGEQRRVGVARLLLGDQPVWLFDEPLANLDSHTMGEVAAAIKGAARGRTVLVITHDPDMLGTDFNLFLGDGHILDQGTHAELMARNQRYRDLVSRVQAERTEVAEAPSESAQAEMMKMKNASPMKVKLSS